MGSDEFYPEERPVHPCQRRRVLDRRAPGHRRRVRGVRRRHRLRHHRRSGRWIPPLFPDADAGAARPRIAGVHAATGPVTLDDYRQWWAVRARRLVAAPGGPGQHDRRARAPPGDPGRLRGRRRLRGVGGPAAPDRGRVGARRPRRPRRQPVYAWGDEFAPGGRHDGEHLAGRVPVAEPAARRIRGTSPVGSFPPNGYGLYDMAGNVWEWTDDFFTPAPPATRRRTRAARRTTRG